MFLFHPPIRGKICFRNFLQAAFKTSIFSIFTGIAPMNFQNNTWRYYSSDTLSQSKVNPPTELPVGSVPICSKNK